MENEILHEINNDNGMTSVKFSTSRNLIVKIIASPPPHLDVLKHIWTSPIGCRIVRVMKRVF